MDMRLLNNSPFKLELDKTITRQAITVFQDRMIMELCEASEKGKGYWWNNQICKLEALENLLGEALAEKDYVSVANYAMMLDARKQMSEEYDAFFGSVYPDLSRQGKVEIYDKNTGELLETKPFIKK